MRITQTPSIIRWKPWCQKVGKKSENTKKVKTSAKDCWYTQSVIGDEDRFPFDRAEEGVCDYAKIEKKLQ